MILSVPELVAQAKASVSCVSAAHAFTQKNAIFIDVRESEETASSPVKNSIAIPRGVLEMNITKYCAEQLQRIGYKNVKAISGSHDEVCQAQKNQ